MFIRQNSYRAMMEEIKQKTEAIRKKQEPQKDGTEPTAKETSSSSSSHGQNKSLDSNIEAAMTLAQQKAAASSYTTATGIHVLLVAAIVLVSLVCIGLLFAYVRCQQQRESVMAETAHHAVSKMPGQTYSVSDSIIRQNTNNNNNNNDRTVMQVDPAHVPEVMSIVPPSECQPGFMKDPTGRCRPIVSAASRTKQS
ncbi:unnamed protein product [Notodromas monacha]|uniref:Uncharacterized protein n=1 Tax=Notodromas monacha TaxID=399045 RepID=A0A7R9BVH1_9CRUS|nr:unnamed protein product [Notodromas monacha]CAG0921530.1 unnamed protein product [Notodromas monacha]